MTQYLFKLARRMASALVAASVLGLNACSDPVARDFLEPGPGTPTTSSSLASLRIASHAGSINFEDYHQFAAWGRTVAGDSVPVAVSWTTTGGQISPSGLFRGTATGTFTVKAFALAQPSLAVTTTISVGEGGSLFTGLKILPEPVTIGGGMSVAFAATAKLVSNGATTAPAVTWTTNGGTISPSGQFISSTVPGTYQVTATTLDGKLTGTASVVIQDAWLTDLELSPKVVILPSGSSQVFEVKATWSDGSSYVPELEWQTAAGTVVALGASGGPQGAPGNGNGGGQLNAGPSPGNYKVIAKHPRSGKSDTALVTVAPALAEVTISPASTSLAPGAIKGFTLSGRMTDGSTVSVAANWTATGGTINGSGVYTAGTQAGSFRVIARTTDGALADTAAVTISEPLATLQGLSISPPSGTVPVSGILHFAASATWSDGSTALPPVAWSASGGSVTQEGRWTAPTSAGTYRVIVRNLAGTQADTATMSVVVPPPSVATLTIGPKTASVIGGQSQAFSASATWTNGSTTLPPLVWSATGGDIAQNGTWVAPEVTGTFKVVVKQADGTLADTASVSVTVAPRVTAIKISPGLAATSTGKTVQFAAAATWNDGVTRPMTFIWTALGGTINTSGLYTAGSLAGQFLVAATCTGCAVTDTVAVTVIESAPASAPVTLTSLVLNPSSMTMDAAEQRTLSVAATWSDGSTTLPPLTWDATGGTLSGMDYTAGATAGSYRIIVRDQGGTKADTTAVTIQAAAAPPPPTGSVGDLVVFPNEAIGFIVGPQLKAGAASNPWSWYDENAVARGLVHGAAFPATAPTSSLDAYINQNYYDLGLTLYTAFYRTGDTRFRDHARKVADSWWTVGQIGSGTTHPESSFAPRNVSLGGLMLRAMDGRPEMWPWIVTYTRSQFQIWLGARLNNSSLHYGVRDGGYMLLYAAWLAKAHPDPAIRAEFTTKARDAARIYYARLQQPDGGWYWHINEANNQEASQPFMIGLLQDGLIAVHRLAADPEVGDAIVKSVGWMYSKAYEQQATSNLPNVRWRAMRYFVVKSNFEYYTRTTALLYGMADGAIRDARQLNSTTIHAFGYAYKITGDPKYRTWGDEVFAATFGRGQGPGADSYYGLADYREKEYNQSYRSASRYLVWRTGN